jgi:hypothetical protein
VSQGSRRKNPESPSGKWLLRVVIIGSVLLSVVLVLVLKERKQAAEPPAVGDSTVQETATLADAPAEGTRTLPEAAGQNQLTAELEQVSGQSPTDKLPES